jgi:SH3-like domain-containing protein
LSKLRVLTFSCLAALALLGGAGAASAQVVEGEEHCVVNVRPSDVLNVREAGRPDSKVVTTLRYGRCGVMVTAACKGSWCPVEDGHFAGWANRKYLSMVSPSIYCVTGVRPGDGLNLRAFPSATSRVVTVLSRQQCDIAFLPYATDNWQKVRVGGYEGWTNQKFLSGE